MALWMLLAALANATHAGVNIVDRRVSRYSLQPRIYAFFFGVAGLVPLILVGPFAGLAVPQPLTLLAALGAGLLYVTAFTLYATALTGEEASQVVALFTALTPVFVLVLSSLWLGKVLEGREYAAFLCLVGGGIVITLKRDASLHSIRRVLGLLVAVSILLAFYQLLVKYVSIQEGFLSTYIWVGLGACLGALGLLALPGYRAALGAAVANATRSTWLLIVGGRILSLTGVALSFGAISLVPFEQLAFVSALGGLQPMFVFLYERVLRAEPPVGRAIVQKTTGLLLVGVGIAVLNLM